MAHPNPGIREDQEYKWTLPEKIIVNNDMEWFHSSHSSELKSRLNRYKDLYVQDKISVYEYCKENYNRTIISSKFDHGSIHVKMLTYVGQEVYFFLLIFF